MTGQSAVDAVARYTPRWAKRAVPRRIRRAIRPVAPPWVVAVEPSEPRPLASFGFFALVGTWMEADVIADTVGNAFAQGVDRVFLLDNDSPDDTVKRAVAAGADHVMTYRTDRFEERYRYNLMNDFARYASETSGHGHVWWLWMDADEFPRPATGGTLRRRLEHLDESIRVVGARVLNHYPSPGQPAYVPGQHPATLQPLVEEMPQNICALQHRKHPLQRWDRGGPELKAGLGFHRAESAQRPLREPTEAIVIHHVPFREESVTRSRLERLWRNVSEGASRAISGDDAADHMQARRDSVDAVYAGDWGRVQNFLPGWPDQGVRLVDWTSLDPPIGPDLPTW